MPDETAWALLGEAVYVAPVPSGADDTAALNALLASMPTDPYGQHLPVGEIRLRPGVYNVGAGGELNNIGPYVKLVGPGKSACTIKYNGNGRCLYCHNPRQPSPTPGFLSITGWASKIDGFTIDGTNAGANAVGLDYGDNESGTIGHDLHIQFFQGANAVGLKLWSYAWWMEKTSIEWPTIRECTTGVLVGFTAPAENSLGYNDFKFVVFSTINQNAVVWNSGQLYNGSFGLRGKSIGGPGNTGSVLLMGAGQIFQSRVDIQFEGTTGAGMTPGHTSINFQGGVIQQCEGIVNFPVGGGLTVSNFLNNAASPAFSFFGIVAGDTALNPDSNLATQLASVVAIGAQRNKPLGFYDSVGTTLYMGTGEFFDLGTLAANLVLVFSQQSKTGQEKTIRIKQAAAGGPFSVTWPNTGSTKVKWASGTAPVGGISQAAGAEDWFVLRSYPGSSGPVVWVAQQIPAVA